MRLRTRLTLAFLLLASLMAVVGLIAVGADRRIEYYVSQVERSSAVELQHVSAMALTLQSATTAAELVTHRYRLRATGAAAPTVQPASDQIEAQLWQGLASFEDHLNRCRAANDIAIQLALAAGDDATAALERDERSRWVDPITERYATVKAEAKEFVRAAAADPAAAHRYLDGVLGPQLRDELLPLVYRYRDMATDQLSREVERISTEAQGAASVVLLTSVAAVILALVLGFTVSRSIATPILALKEAAERLGCGDLTSRVHIASRDELGVLAASFNRMAEDLSTTTVSRGYLRNVIESMAGALIITDPGGGIASVNRAALELLGYDEAELLGQPLSCVYGPAAETAGEPAFARLSAIGSTRGVEETLFRKDGTPVPVAFSGATLRDEHGRIEGFVCVAHDISAPKNVERTLRSFLREKELLLREIHHRVKNNLQVVSSLLDLQSSAIVDPSAREIFKQSQNRIGSMALIHEQLYQTSNLAHIAVGPYIEKLTYHLQASYSTCSDRTALHLEVDESSLEIDQAVTCGLIVNELVTNALKHAFPADHGGVADVRVAFNRTDGGYRLVVTDNGRGFRREAAAGALRGLGLSLVATLVQQLRGTMDIRSDRGTEFRIDFSPLAAIRYEAAHGA